MTYATQTELYARLNDELTDLLSQDATTPTWEQVDKVLAVASSEMDSYISQCYTLPLIGTYPMLVSICCDIARYRLYKNKPHDEVWRRYNNAITWLNKLVNRKIYLHLETETGIMVLAGGTPMDFANYNVWTE